ncbi:hypothetical protein MycrhDRAFT_1150 [Mycolicibacterium rhodesiae JS60]|nr:hypothetical protein MycrhDRAFT_1150 [Mycolicibacterium rhodesiae JS60]
MPLVAQVAAQYWEPHSWLRGDYRDYKKFTPWALADIARISLVSGNESRKPATRDDLLRCAGAYAAQVDLKPSEGGEDDPLVGFLLRIGHEQLVYNQSRYHDLGRSAAIFDQTAPTKPLQVLDGNWIEDLLGCSISQFVGIGFVAHTAAVKNNGRFLEDWLDDPALSALTSKIPIQLMRDVVEGKFVGDLPFFQAERPVFRPSKQRRYTFNPLLDKPIVSGIGESRLVPVPGMIDRKISPLGLWYMGFEKWGTPFADDVGELFEQYVGRQLKLIPDVVVHPEIVYNNQQNRSVDWIVVGEHAVVLVEVKSTRPTEPIRLGASTAFSALGKKLGKAYGQIETSNDKIAQRDSAFNAIPDTLPRIGLIVTMEDFPIANTPMIRGALNISPSIPICVCSSEELEILVTITDEPVDKFLLDFLNDPNKPGWSLTNDVREPKHAHRSNEVLADAWKSYGWGIRPQDDEQAASGEFETSE